MSPLGGGLAGNANVIMQLSRPEVGYGVMNSRVHSGSALHHPVKRARTTFTYIALAILGTEEDRAAFRRAVNGQHAQVVSTPEEPVRYRAMDPELQRWVAACLYAGTRDILDRWTEMLARLETDPNQCDREVDWVIKRQVIEDYMSRHRLSWRDPAGAVGHRENSVGVTELTRRSVVCAERTVATSSCSGVSKSSSQWAYG